MMLQSTDDLTSVFSKSIQAVLEKITSEAIVWFEKRLNDLTRPLTQTPAPEGPSSSAPINIAFRSATNSPWDSLISGLYFDHILGLAFGLQLITLAAVGVRYKSMNAAVRQKIGRRLLLAFGSIFFWLPVASLALQFFDLVGETILTAGSATEQQAVMLINAFTTLSASNLGVLVVLLPVVLYIYLKVAFVGIIRWIAVILLTLTMPLLASFWALEVWPFGRFSGLSKQIAGTYPGAVAAAVPSALLLRLGAEVSSWGLSGLNILVTLATLWLAGKVQKIMLMKSSPKMVQLSEQALTGAKKPLSVGTAAATVGATLAGGPAVGGAIAAGRSALQGNTTGAAIGAQMVHRQMSSSPGGGSSAAGSTSGGGRAVTSGTSRRGPSSGSSSGGSPSNGGQSSSNSSSLSQVFNNTGNAASGNGNQTQVPVTSSSSGGSDGARSADRFDQTEVYPEGGTRETTDRKTAVADGETTRNKPTEIGGTTDRRTKIADGETTRSKPTNLIETEVPSQMTNLDSSSGPTIVGDDGDIRNRKTTVESADHRQSNVDNEGEQ